MKRIPMPELDIAAKFLLGLFAFLGLAACVAVLGGCSSGSSGSPCPAGTHVVLGIECTTGALDSFCDRGSDCTSRCCNVNTLTCVDPATLTGPYGCPCTTNADCPETQTCASVVTDAGIVMQCING
jgi:hypothetical protein